MELEQLKPNAILRSALFNEPVQVVAVVPMGSSVKVIGTGLKTGLTLSTSVCSCNCSTRTCTAT